MKRKTLSRKAEYRRLRISGFNKATARWIIRQGGSFA